ncbi:single-stranded-DNA-specific exonuclease RecJ [Leptolyngbya sp. BL0902]|uniref:single-stranded-DNA-specific exonuclease RecJ n=1 Tax=Leptolyngbya sp. BL0902 TaxID=1115757 RepID=UPI0029393DD2|nr:single-stranded-DNA-specific exonuclease RecJ [Leptolyngbya sp. BL0902]
MTAFSSRSTSQPSQGETARLPRQRWRLPTVNAGLVETLAAATDLSPLMAQVLVQRGILDPQQAEDFLNPERLQLPSPRLEFEDLALSLDLLTEAIQAGRRIAICGDYDADGMTSTALLLRALRTLGAEVDYTIPSRMSEGYGINSRIVEDCHADGVSLILTVDNGIAAVAPIQRARELGLTVIITDHHDLPPQLPPANAILNPKLLPETSPYRGVAGVGVAYILAVCLAQALNQTQDLTASLLELFTLGTIADLAPLTGVNRRWVRRGLGLLPRSQIFGIQALIQVAGLSDQSKALKPEHIGFRLGPRINAVGRLSDPQIVIDLLTTNDLGTALERAMQCEQINTTRQELCQQIEQEAVTWCEQQQAAGDLNLLQDRVLVVVRPQWHHGVIGIVASRLVERYGVPVFIGTYEDEDGSVIRGSARGIPEFDVFEALQSCRDLMEKFGGHRAAGGFSFRAENLSAIRSRLSHYACQTLTPDLLKPLISVDAQAQLSDINYALYEQIDHLHPCGIENPEPIFWTPQVQIAEQQVVGRNREHLKLTLRQGDTTIKAIAWRWGDYFPLPDRVDLAYRLKQNEWQGVTTVELELVGVRREEPTLPQALSRLVESAARPLTPAHAEASPQVSPATEAQLFSQPSAPSAPDVSESSASANGDADPNLGTGPRVAPNPITLHPATAPVTDLAADSAPDPSVTDPAVPPTNPAPASDSQPSPAPSVSDRLGTASPAATDPPGITFRVGQRDYRVHPTADPQQFTITNAEGHRLAINLTTQQGSLTVPGQADQSINITAPGYAALIQAGVDALDQGLIQRLNQEIQAQSAALAAKDQQLQSHQAQLAERDWQIQAQAAQIADLERQLQTQAEQIADQAQRIQALQAQVALLKTAPTSPTRGAKPAARASAKTNSVIQTPSLFDLDALAPVAEMEGAGPTAQPSTPEEARWQQQVRTALGDGIWFCLMEATQQDLLLSFQRREQLALQPHAADPSTDYSAVALPLVMALEREIWAPLVAGLADYGQQMQDDDLIQLTQALQQHDSLGVLPGLVAEAWKVLSDKILPAEEKPRKLSYHTIQADTWGAAWPIGGDPLHDTHRVLLDEFLQGWNHPVSRWLTALPEDAATALAQVHQLHQIALSPAPMRPWHQHLLQQWVFGERPKVGILPQIFREG